MNVDVIVPATFSSLFQRFPDGALVAPYGNVRDRPDAERGGVMAGCSPQAPQCHTKCDQARRHDQVGRRAPRDGVPPHAGVLYAVGAQPRPAAAGGRADGLCRVPSTCQQSWRVCAGSGRGVPGCRAERSRDPLQRSTAAYYMHGGSIEKTVDRSLESAAVGGHPDVPEPRRATVQLLRGTSRARSGFQGRGIRKFKERFGGQFVSGWMWKYPLRPTKYLLYEVAAWIRNGGDVVDQERRRRARG